MQRQEGGRGEEKRGEERGEERRGEGKEWRIEKEEGNKRKKEEKKREGTEFDASMVAQWEMSFMQEQRVCHHCLQSIGWMDG